MVKKILARPITFKNWSAFQLENDFTSMVLIPEIGGKAVSIRSVATGREFLWQDSTRPYKKPRFGDAFANYVASGFDECFPSIGECVYPEFPWKGITVPDHGELWCGPWLAEPRDAGIYLHRFGVRFPYHFEKWVSLSTNAGSYTIAYRLTNLSDFEFKYLWAAHPLLAIQEGMQVVLPDEPQVRLTFALGNRVAGDFLQMFQWPWLSAPSGERVNYSLIGSAALNANDKLYADAPAEGWCALHDVQTGDFIAFSFPPEKLPFVGICINHGGWPFDGVKGYWVALEPCTSLPDELDQAIARNKNAVLAPHSTTEWSLTLHVGQAHSVDAIRQLVNA